MVLTWRRLREKREQGREAQILLFPHFSFDHLAKAVRQNHCTRNFKQIKDGKWERAPAQQPDCRKNAQRLQSKWDSSGNGDP